MKRFLVFVSLLSLVVISALHAQTAAVPAPDGSFYFFSELRGVNEVPPNNSTAVGSTLTVLDPNNLVTFEVSIGSIQNVTASHIHKGAPTCACPVVIPWGPLPAPGTGNSTSEAWIAASLPARGLRRPMLSARRSVK